MPGKTTIGEKVNFSLVCTDNDNFGKEENVIFSKMFGFALLLIKSVHIVSSGQINTAN